MVRTKIKGKKQSEGLAASKDKSRDILPRASMGRGAEFVDGASKFLAAYGKFITPVVAIVLIAIGGYYFWTKSKTGSEKELRNEIEKAAATDKFDELPGKMEEVITKAEEEEMLEVYASYRYAIRAFELLDRPYKVDQLKKVVTVHSDFLEKHGENTEHPAWVERIKSLHAALAADLEFLSSDGNKKLLPWDHHSTPGKPETKLADGNPVVVFVTSVGTFRVELFEDDAGNAVKNFVSLVDEGFYDRTNFSANSFSNSFSAVGPYRNATIISAGAKGRPVGVKLEKPTTAKEEDDVDLVTEENPYSIDYQGSTTQAFAAGSIAFNRDQDDPMRARSEFFVVIEPSDTLIQNFSPLGRVLDGEAGMRIAARLHGAEIYYTYVEQKRKDTTYMPRVYYDGWPVATDKRKEVPDPVRFSKLKQEVTPNKATKDGGLNPLIVIELEKGDIVIEMFEDIAPNTVANFINLIEEGFYDQECEFYRVEGTATDVAEIYETDGARIIQGGFDQSQSREGFDYGIKNEAVDNEDYEKFFNLDKGGLANSRGTIAMARTADLHSASTEVFINIRDFPQWDSKGSPYCVFGNVLYGLDIASEVKKDDKIKSMKVIRKRDHKYVPKVKYKAGDDAGKEIEKKPVTIPKVEDDEDKKDE
jgi:peptidyl-prolyl cis-trans isomerase B (cyclophilin B)